MKLSPRQLVEGILDGDRASLARAITEVENGRPGGREVQENLFSRTGAAWRIGITGPPGCGKSTLTNALVQQLRLDGASVGVIAVDPTSPFTGGALLGDRVRMQTIAMDPEVFIRSMASRGELGGLSATTQEVADLMDAFGKDFVILETVGVGQSEVEVADAADASFVVLSPESGDGIQAMKAGLMEIADVIVMNKSDRDGCDRAVTELELMLRLREVEKGSWTPPIVKTVATREEGIADLAEAMNRHRLHLKETGNLEKRRRENLLKRIRCAADVLFKRRMWKGNEAIVRTQIDEVSDGRKTPAQAARDLFHAILSPPDRPPP